MFSIRNNSCHSFNSWFVVEKKNLCDLCDLCANKKFQCHPCDIKNLCDLCNLCET